VAITPLIRSGVQAYRRGDYAAARQAWERAAGLEGKSHGLCRGLALLAEALEIARGGRSEDSRQLLEEALHALDPLPDRFLGLDLHALRTDLARSNALAGAPPRLRTSDGGLGRSAVRFASFVALVAAAAALVRWGPLGPLLDRELLIASLMSLRESWWAPLALVGGYLVFAPLGLPASPLVLTGGIVFGAGLGTALNLLGSIVGAMASYQLARTLGRDFVLRIAGKRLRRVEFLLARRGFWSLVGARLMPLPFSVVNFGAALAGVRPTMFLTSSALGLLPPTAIYTYFASLLLEIAQGGSPRDLWKLGVAMALLFSSSLLPMLWQGRQRRRRYRILTAERALRNGRQV
jgi:uncharacterized membrane protein YdjX (TVP38/TMEM64 family)